MVLNKGIYIAIQSWLIPIFSFALNELCQLAEWSKKINFIIPGLAFAFSYLLLLVIVRFSFKSLEQSKYEKAQDDVLIQINERLKNNPSEEEKTLLLATKKDIEDKKLKMALSYLNTCEKEFEESLINNK